MPRTHLRSLMAFPRGAKPVALLVAIALVIAAAQLLSPAGAEGVVITQVAGAQDAGAVDMNHDGVADVGRFGAAYRSLSVGEHAGDGSDLRLFLPFTVSADALAALGGGGSANVAVRVRRTEGLAGQRLVIDGYTNGTTARKVDYNRAATRLVKLAPVGGRLAVDVSPLLRSMTGPGTLTLRLRLGSPAPTDGALTQINVATSESRVAAYRPVLTVSSARLAPATQPPAPSSTPTSKPAPQPEPTTTTQPAPATPSTPAADEVFRDDFNGSALDLTKWRPNWLAGTDDAITKPVNSAELSCYDPAQVSVADGFLHLRAVDRACRCGNNGVTYPYASGLVESAEHFTFTYGRIEARIWLPPRSGSAPVANWPAFWANGTGTWPVTGELDVMEGLEGNACWHFHSPAGGPGGCAPWANPSGWHTFAADWRPGAVTYFYDGVQVGRIASGITSSPMYLIFNLAVSTSIAPPVQLPSEMLVDWVRVTR